VYVLNVLFAHIDHRGHLALVVRDAHAVQYDHDLHQLREVGGSDIEAGQRLELGGGCKFGGSETVPLASYPQFETIHLNRPFSPATDPENPDIYEFGGLMFAFTVLVGDSSSRVWDGP